MNAKSLEPMPRVLLVGQLGSGKTHSLRTILDAGLELFVIKTEPSEILDDLPPAKCHWRYIAPAQPSWAVMLQHAQYINQLSFKALAGVDDIEKSKYTQFIDVVKACNNFVDDRTGQAYGDVMTWGHDRALVIDGLSGLSIMSKKLMCGSKPNPDRGEWGVAMDNLENFLNMLITSTKCLFVLTAHTEREPDLLTGGSSLMVSTLGQKLAPKVPRFFSDVIHCKRTGTQFTWNTLTDNIELKARNVLWSNDQPASFVPLLQRWRQRHEQAAKAAA